MTEINQDLPAVLRRRAKQLQDDHYNGQFTGVFMRAADELTVRRRCETHGDQAMIEAVADNRRLRNTLQGLFGRIKSGPFPKASRVDLCKLIAGTLAAVKEPGVGRRIMAISLADDVTREQAEEYVTRQLDEYYVAKAPVLIEAEQAAQGPFEQARTAFHAHLDGCGRCTANMFDLCPIGAGLLKGAACADDDATAAHGVDGDSRPLGTGEPLPNL